MSSGEYLSHKMISAKIKGKELAVTMGVTESNLSAIRNDIRRMSIGMAFLLQAHLDGFDAKEALVAQLEYDIDRHILSSEVERLTKDL